MYIGLDLTEKSGVNSVIDKIDFTFGISSYSIPYLDIYGIDYSDSYNVEVLLTTLTNGITRLGIDNLKISNLDINKQNKQIYMTLDYNGQSISRRLD